MSRKAMIDRVAMALEKSKRLLVLSHTNPDGDAIGSSLALARELRAVGKIVDVVNIDGVPEALRWLSGSEKVLTAPKNGGGYDTLALIDCSDISRTGFDGELFSAIPVTVVIDHHPSTPEPAAPELIDPSAAATGVLVRAVLRHMNLAVSPFSAEALYAALYTDTGGFRFTNTGIEAFELASELVGSGADPARVAFMLLDQEEPRRLKLLGPALETIALTGCGRVATMHVTREMLKEAGATDEDTDGFVNYPRSLKGVDVALLFKERAEGAWRVALRARTDVDVSAVARELGGGGHRAASGVTIEGSLEEAMEQVVGRMIETLDC